jgi:hypothetical protein
VLQIAGSLLGTLGSLGDLVAVARRAEEVGKKCRRGERMSDKTY